MLKKLLIWGGLGMVGVAAFNGLTGRGGVNTCWKQARAHMQKAVSPEFELERLRDQVAQLTPDMSRNISKIAEEMVAVESLERRCGEIQVALDKQKKAMTTVMDQIEANVTRVRLPGNGREVNVAEANRKLKADLKSYQAGERDLASKQKQLQFKKEALETARQQLGEIRSQKLELENMVAEYETELATLRLAQTKSKFKLNDSRLADIKASFERLRERLDVERKTAELTGQFFGESAPADKAEEAAAAKTATAEARDYFKQQDAQGTQD